MAQVILSNKQSNSGSPYVIYSIEVTPSNRTMSSIDLAFKITSHLKNADSSLGTGTGYGLKGKLIINGQTLWWDDDTSKEGYRTYNAPILKGRYNSWSGKGDHNVYYTYTLSNIAWDTTSIPVSFYVIRTSGNTSNAGYLATTNCTNITIDRGAAPSSITSVSSGTTNFAPSIVWTPLDSSFKFKIRYAYSSWEHYTDFITPNTTNPYTYNSYTINSSTIAPYMTNATSGVFSATLYTYDSSGNYIGESSASFNVALNSDVKPTATITNNGESGDVPLSWNVYVKGKSRINISMTGTGIYGSSITSNVISGNGYTYNYNGTTIRTNYLTTNGSITFTATTTDSRSRQGSASFTINVLDYYNPSFTTTQVQRCDVNGSIDSNGEYCYYNFAGSISSCGGNNKANTTYKIGYREHNVGSYNYITIDSAKDSISTSGILQSNGTKIVFDTSKTYDLLFVIQDTFVESTSLQTLDTGFDLMNFNANGKAMAIGKVSEAGANEELFEVGIPFKIEDGIKYVELTNENILTLKPGYYFKEGSTGWGENNWPIATWHATLKVSGTAYDNNNGYRILEVFTTDNRVYKRTQSWNSWSGWEQINNNLAFINHGDNLDNFQDTGYYLGNQTNNISNSPDGNTTIDGLLVVERVGSDLMFATQTFYYSNGYIYKRMSWFGAYWTSWSKIN